jgi:hypothetical protein
MIHNGYQLKVPFISLMNFSYCSGKHVKLVFQDKKHTTEQEQTFTHTISNTHIANNILGRSRRWRRR